MVLLMKNNNGIIPLMNTETVNGFTVTASTYYDSREFYAPWRACDYLSDTEWAMYGNSFPSYFYIQCPQKYTIWKIEISKRYENEWIDTFYFEGSNDGNNWSTLAYSTGQMASIGPPPAVLTLLINDTSYTSYSIFRIRCIAGIGPNPGIAVFQMYAYDYLTLPSTGPAGPAGPAGYSGPTGNIGIPGPTGPTGVGAGVTTGSWTLSAGANTVSFTVPENNSYIMWVKGNIPNGIVTWNATVSISNANVPVIGNQYAWYYSTGNALVLTSIPNQIIGTQGTISTSTQPAGNTTNVFTFGITNNSGSAQVVEYGYITL
jgi:hypothetical protein